MHVKEYHTSHILSTLKQLWIWLPLKLDPFQIRWMWSNALFLIFVNETSLCLLHLQKEKTSSSLFWLNVPKVLCNCWKVFCFITYNIIILVWMDQPSQKRKAKQETMWAWFRLSGIQYNNNYDIISVNLQSQPTFHCWWTCRGHTHSLFSNIDRLQHIKFGHAG